jgi:hypothetical protein
MNVYVINRFDSANHSIKNWVYSSRKKAGVELMKLEEQGRECGVYFRLEKHKVK